MIRLLHAGWNRLKKNVLFWGIVLFTLVVSGFLIYTNYMDMIDYNYVIEIEPLLIRNLALSGIVIAVFASLFIGREYSDGTMRNKIVLHISRTKIYLSNLILVFGISALMEVLHLVVISSIGIPLFGAMKTPLSDWVGILFCIFASILAFSAIFTFCSMINSNKTVNAVAALLLAFGMLVASTLLLNRINAPEYINVAQIVDDKYEAVQQKNPKYLSENQRTLYMHLLKSIPSGQHLLIDMRVETDMATCSLYSFGVTLLFTSAGLFLFNRKELK